MSQTYAYASFEAKSGMLAVWIGEPPDDRDPDAWATGCARTERSVRALAELVKEPNVKVEWTPSVHAEAWREHEQSRRSAAKRALRARAAKAQTAIPIPEDIETRGREAAMEYRR